MSFTSFLTGLFKQIVLMVLFISLPIIWLSNIDLFDTIFLTLLSFSFLIIVEGIIYVKLPVDLIPDCVPIIGTLDDGIAYLCIVGGIWSIIILIIIQLYFPYLLLS